MPQMNDREPKYTIRIEQDNYPDNPRETNENFGTMVCWHRKYNLGDKHEYTDPSEFFRELVGNTFSANELVNYCTDIPQADIRLVYNAPTDQWYLQDTYNGKWYTEYMCTPEQLDFEETKDRILDCLSGKSLMELANKKNILMPLYLYDHSGISISCSHGYPYNDRWDAGQVGWIYVSYDEVQRCYGEVTPETIAKAEQCMETEVSEYDSYLRSDCYGYTIEKNGEEVDSCWGYIGDMREMIAEMRSNANEEYRHLFDHVDYCCTEYSEYEPDGIDKDDQAKVIVQGYEVIDRRKVGSREFVLAHNPNAPSPYVTWKCKAGTNDMYHGHYFCDKSRAEHDFKRRINEERSYER